MVILTNINKIMRYITIICILISFIMAYFGYTQLVYDLCLYIVIIYISVWAHELGHYISGKLLGFDDVKFVYTKYFDIIKVPSAVRLCIPHYKYMVIKHVTIKEFVISISGPLVGYIPILISFVITNDLTLLYILSIAYICGCGADIIDIFNILSKKDSIRKTHMFTPESLDDCNSLNNCNICTFYKNECSGNKEHFKN